MSSPTPAREGEVIVVGGGIIGCACAYYLSQRGVSVLVLERENVAAGASGACDGHLSVQTKAAGLQTELAVESLGLYRGLPRSFREWVEWRDCGSLLIAETEEEAVGLEAPARARREAGVAVEMLTGERARQVEPALAGHVLAATHCATDAQANPWKITSWFAEAATESGARIERGATVEGLEPDERGVTVRTSAGGLRAGHVVVAAGAWTSGLAPELLADCIRPRRGEILVTERLPRLLNGLVISASYLAKKFGADATSRVPTGGEAATLAAEQTAAGNVLIGGTRDFVGFDRSVSAAGTRALAQRAVRALPALASAHLIRSFAGLRPYTPDGLPLVGAVAGVPRVVLAAGHEGDGITLAAITGELVGGYLAEGAELPEGLAAGRFGER